MCFFIVTKSCKDGIAEFWFVSESCFDFLFGCSEFLDGRVEFHDVFYVVVCFGWFWAVIS